MRCVGCTDFVEGLHIERSCTCMRYQPVDDTHTWVFEQGAMSCGSFIFDYPAWPGTAYVCIRCSTLWWAAVQKGREYLQELRQNRINPFWHKDPPPNTCPMPHDYMPWQPEHLDY